MGGWEREGGREGGRERERARERESGRGRESGREGEGEWGGGRDGDLLSPSLPPTLGRGRAGVCLCVFVGERLAEEVSI